MTKVNHCVMTKMNHCMMTSVDILMMNFYFLVQYNGQLGQDGQLDSILIMRVFTHLVKRYPKRGLKNRVAQGGQYKNSVKCVD